MEEQNMQEILKRIRNLEFPEGTIDIREGFDDLPFIPKQAYVRLLNDHAPGWKERTLFQNCNLEAGFCDAEVELTIEGISRTGYAATSIIMNKQTKEPINIANDMISAQAKAFKVACQKFEIGLKQLIPYLAVWEKDPKKWAVNPAVVREEWGLDIDTLQKENHHLRLKKKKSSPTPNRPATPKPDPIKTNKAKCAKCEKVLDEEDQRIRKEYFIKLNLCRNCMPDHIKKKPKHGTPHVDID